MNLQEAHDAAVRARNEELSKAASDARRPYVVAQKANLARLAELIEDAEAAMRGTEALSDQPKAMFYDGVVTGLRRAVMVLEGRG